MLPLLAVLVACPAWYLFYRTGWHLPEKLSDALMTLCLTFGVIYALIAGAVINRVFDEYKDMRTAVKNCDIDTFMTLRDEEVSPVIHAVMALFALNVIACIGLVNYPAPIYGLIAVGVTTYLFSLVYWVITEIDDPCTGVWFIVNIHQEWLAIEPKEWRKIKYDTCRQDWDKYLPREAIVEELRNTA